MIKNSNAKFILDFIKQQQKVDKQMSRNKLIKINTRILIIKLSMMKLYIIRKKMRDLCN